MQATDSVGHEPQMDFTIRENGIREMQDVLSRYLPRFYRSAYRQLGNEADAEDAVQDALLAGYEHLDQFKGEAQMSTWLTAIVTNCARMQLRRRPRQPHVSLDEPLGGDQEYCLSDRLGENSRAISAPISTSQISSSPKRRERNCARRKPTSPISTG